MKILLAFSKQLSVQGIYNGMTELGHGCQRWMPEGKSIYDTLFEVKPDLFIISKYMIQPHYAEALKEHGVRSVIIEDINLEPAANTSEFYSVEYDEKFSSDILYISLPGDGGMIEMMPYLDMLFNIGHKLKVFSLDNLSKPYYAGAISIEESRKLISSTKICLDFNNSIICDAAAMKTFCLSTKENPLYPNFSTIKECKELVEHHLANQKHSNSIVKKANKYILNGNTFVDRCKQILEWAEQNESNLVTDVFKNLAG